VALWLPPAVRAQDHVDRIEGWVRDFDRALKNIDSALSLVFLNDETEPVYGIVPGRWHVRYRRQDALNFMPILDRDGGYMEPHYGVLDQIRRADLGKDENFQRIATRQERERKDLDKRRARASEERVDEMAGRIKASLNPGILFGDNNWSYRAGKAKA
jgi:hypothetical protein